MHTPLVARRLLVAALLVAWLSGAGTALAQNPPDLTVDQLQLGTANDGSKLKINAEVRNRGGTSSQFDVTIGGPGFDRTERFPGLNPGDAAAVQVTIPFPTSPEGGSSVTVIADPRNSVPESDESNNYASAPLGDNAVGQPSQPDTAPSVDQSGSDNSTSGDQPASDNPTSGDQSGGDNGSSSDSSSGGDGSPASDSGSDSGDSGNSGPGA